MSLQKKNFYESLPKVSGARFRRIGEDLQAELLVPGERIVRWITPPKTNMEPENDGC